MAVVFWSLLAVTGLGLLFFYQPSPEAARQSLVELREATAFDFLRSLHYWASHGLIIAAWLHLMRVFVVGSYRRLLGWTVSVLLVTVLIAQAWTGFLLSLGEGGAAISLTMVYALHVAWLPLLTVALVGLWRRRRGAREARERRLQHEASP